MYHGPDHRSHSGIGKATALSLADRGAHVLVGGRDAACGDAVVAPIQAKGGIADFVAADLRSADPARSFARRAIELGGGHVDIWSTTPPSSPWVRPRKLAKEDIDAAFAVNVKVPFVLVAELAPAMAARGKGAIINVGTVAAEFGIPGMSLYGATKASLVLLTTPHSGLLHQPLPRRADPDPLRGR